MKCENEKKNPNFKYLALASAYSKLLEIQLACTISSIFCVRTIKLLFQSVFFVRKAGLQGLITTLLSLVKNLAFSKNSLLTVPENVKTFRITKRFCLVSVRLVLKNFFLKSTFLYNHLYCIYTDNVCFQFIEYNFPYSQTVYHCR